MHCRRQYIENEKRVTFVTIFSTHQNNSLLLNLNIAALGSHFHCPSSLQYCNSPGTSPDLLFGVTWFSCLNNSSPIHCLLFLSSRCCTHPEQSSSSRTQKLRHTWQTIPLIAQLCIFLTPQRSSLQRSPPTHTVSTQAHKCHRMHYREKNNKETEKYQETSS